MWVACWRFWAAGSRRTTSSAFPFCRIRSGAGPFELYQLAPSQAPLLSNPKPAKRHDRAATYT